MRHRVAAAPSACVIAYADRHFFKLVLAMLAVFGGLGTFAAIRRWKKLSGHEPEWIAQALASGHGYSFDGAHRWLFSAGGAPDQYFATAWADPAFTVLYAAIIALFGEWSRLLIVLLLLACLLLTAALVASITRRLAGPFGGLLALVVLLVTVQDSAVKINASLLAGLWLALLLSLLVTHAERLSLRTSIGLGALLGISVLTWSSTMVFVPVVVLLLFWFAPTPRSALRMSTATVLTAMLLVAPWTVRNYLVFDEFVPVRTGLGHLAHIATIGLTNTFASERTMTSVPAPFRSSDPFDAVASQVARDSSYRRALFAWQRYDLSAQLGQAGKGFNEAQKDRWLLHKAMNFVIAEPLTTAQLAIAKHWQFLRLSRWPFMAGLTAGLTVFGLAVCSVLAFRDRRLLIPMMLALAYMAQFVIIVPLYYRYRYPLEPVIAVLIGVSLARVAEVGLRSLGAVLPGRRQVSAEQAPHAVHTPVAPIQHAGRQSHAPS